MLAGLRNFCRGLFPESDLYCESVSCNDFHFASSSNLTAVSGTSVSAGENMTTPLPAVPSSYLRIIITEDCSDSLIVPECRVRPGCFDPSSKFIDKAYRENNRPDRIYTGKEIDCPIEGSVIISQGDCYISLRSRIARGEINKPVKAFSVLCKYGVTVSQPQAVLARQDGNDDVVTQVFRVNYTNNKEFGCIVFRCVADNLIYNKDKYYQQELLTVYFHRTNEDYGLAPYPPVVTLTTLQEQNYVPMVPGQVLQIIPNTGEVEIEDCQSDSDRSLLFLDKEQLSKNSKFWIYRYQCIRVSEVTHPFFIKGEQTCSLIVPPTMVEDDDFFTVVTHPHKTVKILCSNLTSLRLRFVKDIPVMYWPKKAVEIPSVNSSLHELKIKFHKRISSVNLLNENGTCSISCTLPGFGTYSPIAKK